jgi:flagellar biosynthesis/type III secretory pathway protein FliH
MERLYDITKDYLYQEGLTKGLEQGLTKGIEKGKREVIVKMLVKQKLTPEGIADFACTTEEHVQAVAKELKK